MASRSRLSSRSMTELSKSSAGVLKSSINVPPRRTSFAGLYSKKGEAEKARLPVVSPEEMKQRRKENIARLRSLTGIEAFSGFELDPDDANLSPIAKLQRAMTHAKESGMTIEQIFSFFGTVNEDNEISAENFGSGIRRLGKKLFEVSDPELMAMVAAFDTDGDGQVTLDEFKAFCYKIPTVAWRAEAVRYDAGKANPTQEDTEWKRALAKETQTRAQKLLNAKDYVKAETLFSEALQLSESGEYFASRAACRCGLGKLVEALEDADAAIRLEPTLSRGYYRRAQALSKSRDHLGATKAYETASECEPNNSFFKSMVSQERRLAAQGDKSLSMRRHQFGHLSTILSSPANGAGGGAAPFSPTSPTTPNMQRRLWTTAGAMTTSGKPGVEIFNGSKLFWRTGENVDVLMHRYDETDSDSSGACIVIAAYNVKKDASLGHIYVDTTKILVNQSELAEALSAARQEYIIRESPSHFQIPAAEDEKIQKKVYDSSVANFLLLRLVIEPTLSLQPLSLDTIQGSLVMDEPPIGLEPPFIEQKSPVAKGDVTELFLSRAIDASRTLAHVSNLSSEANAYQKRASIAVQAFKTSKRHTNNKVVCEILRGCRKLQVERTKKHLLKLSCGF